ISRNNLEKAIVRHLESTVRSRTRHIETWLKIQKSRVMQLSQSEVFYNILHTGEQDSDHIDKFAVAIERMMRTEKVDESIYEVFVLNAKGKIVASSDKKNIGQDGSTNAYFLGAKSGPYIKDAYFSKKSGQELIAVSAPIVDRDTQKRLGVVCIRMNMSLLNQITTDKTGLGQTGEIYLINKQGYMITPSRFIKNTVLNLKVDTENARKYLEFVRKYGVKTNEHEAFIYPDYRGVAVMGVYDHIPEMQWGLIGKIDESEALMPLNKIKITFIIIIFSIPFAAWLGGVFVSRWIAGPIRELQEGAEVIGQGDLDYKVATDSKDEIGQLSRAFDKMTRDLKKKVTSLEKEMARRKQAEEELRESRQQLRNLSAYLQFAREQQRTSIAREIHDELGQLLTALKMDISFLNNRLSIDQGPLLNKTKSMTQLIDAGVESVQRICSELRPGLLDDLGISAAIEWQIQEFANRTGIKYRITITPEDMTLAPDLSTAIFRIFQEALTNIVRHADATMVNVSLTQKDDELILEVADNGKGITPKQISDSKSFGLLGMRERALYYNGDVKITGAQGKGSTVWVSVFR
ncbi:MAG TPA: cache domain-containing protein, partial [Desulfobacterales bacterium]|nr:cache domain-containing protein [Desulfobacterales bacterium]